MIGKKWSGTAPWVSLLIVAAFSATTAQAETVLSPRNREAPFCYQRGSLRSWPILNRPLRQDESLTLTARAENKTLASGNPLRLDSWTVSIGADGKLTIDARPETPQAEPLVISLEVTLQRKGQTVESQTLQVRPAPPNRPISYLADLLDDLIRIFWDPKAGSFREIEKSGFDQYFRRLQAHGVSRLIVWQSPFPYSVDLQYLPAEDWSRYRRQSQAILESQELTQGMAGSTLASWKWIRLRMKTRMTDDFAQMLSRSAMEHNIKLTASFRPFEPALTKYYEVPTFDQQGRWLWSFLPMAWPTVNYHPQQVCLANARTILKKMGRPESAEPESIEFTQVENAQSLAERISQGESGLRIVASHFPPIDTESFVLVRDEQQNFTLKRYRQIQQLSERQQVELTDCEVTVADDAVRISNLRVPPGYRYLIIARSAENFPMIHAKIGRPIIIRSRAGNRLGRVNIYRVLDPSDPDAALTRIAGITPDGMYRATFQAIEKSIDTLGANPPAERLDGVSFVVDFGADWSVEMLDFQRPATRGVAVAQLKTMLAYPAFDEIFINTRSHCQLAATSADDMFGDGGVAPLEHYRTKHIIYRHLGIDLAFAPISLASNRRMNQLASMPETIEQISAWVDDAWLDPCQSPKSPFAWRYERNLAISAGLRQLFQDLESEFPGVRIRAVIPPSERAIRAVWKDLDKMPKPDGQGMYGKDYYRHIRGSLNHIPAIGAGMAMVDLTGLSVEPVFLGIRYAPDSGPLDLYLREVFHDLADNLGSTYHGPRSFFYEAQETLRGKDLKDKRRKRERIIRHLLSQSEEINEVILYEAADWTYYLRRSEGAKSFYSFLDPPDEP